MFQQTFSLSHDEVVRGEYFSHANEPALTFNPSRGLIYINAAGLRRLPNMEYALLVISPSEKRLSIFPCDTGERDAVRLRSGGRHRNKPRRIRCRIEFLDKMLSLMGWARDCRYKMIGYLATGNGDEIIAFDLSSAERFLIGECSANIPARAHDEFGSAFDEHSNNPLSRKFEQDIEITTAESEAEADHEV